MGRSKLDVSKDWFKTKSDGETLSDGEALLRSANFISEGFFGKRGVINRKHLEDLGITSEMTRVQIDELLTGLDESIVYTGPEILRVRIKNILELLHNKGIVTSNSEGDGAGQFKELLEYIKQYCMDTRFHDRQ